MEHGSKVNTSKDRGSLILRGNMNLPHKYQVVFKGRDTVKFFCGTGSKRGRALSALSAVTTSFSSICNAGLISHQLCRKIQQDAQDFVAMLHSWLQGWSSLPITVSFVPYLDRAMTTHSAASQPTSGPW